MGNLIERVLDFTFDDSCHNYLPRKPQLREHNEVGSIILCLLYVLDALVDGRSQVWLNVAPIVRENRQWPVRRRRSDHSHCQVMVSISCAHKSCQRSKRQKFQDCHDQELDRKILYSDKNPIRRGLKS